MRQGMRSGEPAPESSGVTLSSTVSPRGGLSWRGLARIAAAGDLVVLAAVGIGRGDMEAVAIAALLAVAALLAGWRRGLVGLVMLALLFIDVAAFMLPAAVSNPRAGEALGGVALPASLAVVALVGLVAVVAALAAARRGRTAAGRTAATGRAAAYRGEVTALGQSTPHGQGPVVVAAGAAALLIAALGVVGVAGPSRATATEGSQPLALQAAGTAFSSTSLEARPGRVTVSLANRDLFWHTFTVEQLGANVDVPVGGTRSVTFTVAPGTYAFVCTIPGHASAGMRGTLVVR
jgi:plastocyanin